MDTAYSSDLLATAGQASGASDLLPTNTAIFASTARVPRLWYLLATLGCSTAGLLFFLSVGATSKQQTGAMLGSACVILCVWVVGRGWRRSGWWAAGGGEVGGGPRVEEDIAEWEANRARC